MIRRIDRYVWGEIAPPTIVALSVYVFLLLMNVVFDVAREAIQNHLSLVLVLQLLYYQLPQLLVVCVPMSVLVGILIGVGRMAADSELVALQAAGIPTRSLLPPIAAWGLLWAGVCFYFIAFVAPEGAYLHHTLRREVYLSRYANLDRLAPRTFHESLQELLLYYEAREPDTGGYSRVFLREQDDATGVERITVARRGEFRVDRRTGQLTVFLEDGATHVRRLQARPEESYTLTTFATYQETREPPGYVRSFSEPLNRHQHEMTLEQLRADIARARAEENEAVRQIRTGLATTNWQERFALPSAAIVFAVLGLPLGTINRRGGRASGFALSLAVALLYWVVYSALREMSESGHIPATWLWAPNLFFLTVAIVLPWLRRPEWLPRFRRARRAAPTRQAEAATNAPAGPAPAWPDEPDVHPRHLVFPHLLDRYVGFAFLKVFFVVILAVDLVYLLIEFRSIVDDMVDRQSGSAALIWSYLGLVLPRMTLTILPVACLVAALIGLGLMARAREDVAVRAMGVSLHRLLLPVLVLTAALSTLGFVLQDSLIPSTTRAAAGIRDRLSGRAPRSSDPRQRWVMAADARLYHYEDAGPNSDALQGFSTFELDPATFAIRSRTFAERAVWDGAAWRLENTWTRRFQAGDSSLEQNPVAALPAAGPDLFRQTRPLLERALRRETEQLTRREQRQRVRDLDAKGYDTTALRVALSQELALSFVPCLMVVLGFPFSFHVGARGSMFGIAVAIGIAALYWSFLAVFGALGTAGFLPPLLAAWAPNVFFGGFGAWVLLHLRT